MEKKINIVLLIAFLLPSIYVLSQDKIELRAQTGYGKTFFNGGALGDSEGFLFDASARYYVHNRFALGVNASFLVPVGTIASTNREYCASNLNSFYYGFGGEYYINQNKLQGYFGLTLNATHHKYGCYSDVGPFAVKNSNIPEWYEQLHVWMIPRAGLKYQLNEKWSAFTEFGYGLMMYSTLNHDTYKPFINTGIGLTYKL